MCFLICFFLFVLTFSSCCESTSISNTIAKTLQKMSHNGACEDFYKYACGTDDSIKEDTYEEILIKMYRNRSEKHEALKMFTKFYESCMDYGINFNYTRRMEKVKEIVDQCNNSATNLTELFGQLVRRQALPFFDVDMGVDDTTSKIIYQLNLPKYFINNWWGISALKKQCLKQANRILLDSVNKTLSDAYSHYKKCSTNYGDYFEKVNRTMKQLYPEISINESDLKHIIAIFEALPDSVEVSTVYEKNSVWKISLAELDNDLSMIDWRKFFIFLYDDQIDENMDVLIYFKEYFTKIFQKLKHLTQNGLRDILLAIHAHDLYITTVIEPDRTTGSKYCIDLAKVLFPGAWNYLNQDYVNNDQKTYLEKMFEKLKETFQTSLRNNQWTALAEDCNRLKLYLQKKEKLKDNNVSYVFEDYQSDLVELLVKLRRKIYSHLNYSRNDKNLFFTYFFDPLRSKPRLFLSDTIVAPHNLIGKISPNQPEFLNLAKVGLYLAQQIAEKLGSSKIRKLSTSGTTKYKSYEDLENITKTSMDSSRERKFNNIIYDFNGTSSTNSRILDNTAFRLLMDLVKFDNKTVLPFINCSDFSQEKIFYIATAQEFCRKTSTEDFMLQIFEDTIMPVALRVESIFGNSRNFSEAFRCADGSEMTMGNVDVFPYLPSEGFSAEDSVE